MSVVVLDNACKYMYYMKLARRVRLFASQSWGVDIATGGAMRTTEEVELESTLFSQLRRIVRDLPPRQARQLLRQVLATLPGDIDPEDDDLRDYPED
jgi:hypothetical protein